MTAHPRSRGENWFADAAKGVADGSSPLTRGKLEGERHRVFEVRLIPAHAGKTARSGHARSGAWAHPRSRGENAAGVPACDFAAGSSPLTRGKHALSIARLDAAGLIPAHAGKTSSPRPRILAGPAHPRSRGENAHAVLAAPMIDGSSPLTRGKRDRGGGGRHRHGLIPAHAGKTGRHSIPIVRALGSSPLTRGKRTPTQIQRLRPWLIPAHAGKTVGTNHGGPGTTAHPRSRGENTPRPRTALHRAGSSPLTRGKQPADYDAFAATRLIPAHAGKTPHRTEPTRAPSGSSPLTRGKLVPVGPTASA